MSSLGVLDPQLYARGDPSIAGLPLELYARLRDETPCYWQSLDEEPLFLPGAWVVTRYSDVLAILRDTARFSNTGGTSVRRYDPMVVERGGMLSMPSPISIARSRAGSLNGRSTAAGSISSPTLPATCRST
jgi:cytochrome P450